MNTHLHRLLGLLAATLLAVLFYIVLVDTEPGPAPQRFEQAQVCVQPTDETRYERSGLSAIFSRPMDVAASCWQSTALPDHVRARPADHAVSTAPSPGLLQAWFKVSYTAPVDMTASETVLIYVPRVMGAAWQLLVNGQPVANNLDDWRMTWNKPLAVRLDPSRVHAGQKLDIRIGVIGRVQYGASIAPSWSGLPRASRPHWHAAPCCRPRCRKPAASS